MASIDPTPMLQPEHCSHEPSPHQSSPRLTISMRSSRVVSLIRMLFGMACLPFVGLMWRSVPLRTRRGRLRAHFSHRSLYFP